jgi:hypothetical protein
MKVFMINPASPISLSPPPWVEIWDENAFDITSFGNLRKLIYIRD